MEKITEQTSNYSDLNKMSVSDILSNINKEDQSVALAVERVLPTVETLVESIILKMELGGRLFYIGSGTSGRLGILDASECPPTFGIPHNQVVGIIAGGDKAIRVAQELAEDDPNQAWIDLQGYEISDQDIVIGISASGTTTYVEHGLLNCRKHKITTACIVNNRNSSIAEQADFPIEIVTGAEFLTGSTRMKAGSAQKMVLNMITTATMIKLGHVYGNKMIDMKLSNNKLVDRGTKMVMELAGMDYGTAREALLRHGSVRKVLESKGTSFQKVNDLKSKPSALGIK